MEGSGETDSQRLTLTSLLQKILHCFSVFQLGLNAMVRAYLLHREPVFDQFFPIGEERASDAVVILEEEPEQLGSVYILEVRACRHVGNTGTYSTHVVKIGGWFGVVCNSG
jgi:hypothetical protein